METAGYLEILIPKYQTTRRRIRENYDRVPPWWLKTSQYKGFDIDCLLLIRWLCSIYIRFKRRLQCLNFCRDRQLCAVSCKLTKGQHSYRNRNEPITSKIGLTQSDVQCYGKWNESYPQTDEACLLLNTSSQQTQGHHYFWVHTGPCNWTRAVHRRCSANCVGLHTKCTFHPNSLNNQF